jgi:DNA replicative helicase MCM subunit Mcm2 (Cdc46/Mcm family)
MKPGDHVVITGIYTPMPVQGRGRNKDSLLRNTVLLATQVEQMKESYAEHVISDEVRNCFHLLCSFRISLSASCLRSC